MAKQKAKGLGDTIESITEATGIKAAVEMFSKATGIDCGCDERKAKLNELFSSWDTYYNSKSSDLYFVGIKKGAYIIVLRKYVNDYVEHTTLKINA